MTATMTTIAERHVDSTASRQWVSRPNDQRYTSLAELGQAVRARRLASKATAVPLDHCRVVASHDGQEVLWSSPAAEAAGARASLTHWSLGQLCQRAAAAGHSPVPAGYLRTLPAPIAALNLQWALERAREDSQALVQGAGANGARTYELRAITSGTYGRVWDSDLIDLIEQLPGVAEGRWQIPSASYAATDPRLATTLYASDRDVWVFLVDTHTPIEVTNETLYRGFYAWNSEVGSASLGLATFLYRTVCDNRNIWGQKDFRELRIRHTGAAPQRLALEVAPQLARFADASPRGEADAIRRAIDREMAPDRDRMVAWMRSRGFAESLALRAYGGAERAGLNPRSVWGAVQGLTGEAHALAHQDSRIQLERAAGDLLDLV